MTRTHQLRRDEKWLAVHCSVAASSSESSCCGGALSPKRVSVSVDHLCFVAGGSQRAPRGRLGNRLRRLLFPRAAFALGLGLELGGSALLPISDDSQIGCAHEPLVQPHLLRSAERQELLLGTASDSLRAVGIAARPSGARGALAEHACLAIDPLLAQPVQGLERVAVTHGPSLAKPRREEGQPRFDGHFPQLHRPCGEH